MASTLAVPAGGPTARLPWSAVDHERVLSRLSQQLALNRARTGPVSLRDLTEAGVVSRSAPPEFRTNFGRTFRLTPALWARPRNPDELQRVVLFACQQRLPIKAVGSLCTWSPAARPEDSGITLLTDRLTGVEDPEADLLRGHWEGPRTDRPPATTAAELIGAHHLVRVYSGTTIWDLNDALDERGLALKTMGAFGGERVGGAFNTGTHGSSTRFGPMCDSAVSIDAVWQGVPVRLEPADGPTDPGRFERSPAHRSWVLVQDDAVFAAALLSYGTMGAVTSYLLDVGPRYYLEEIREDIGRDAVRREIRAVAAGAEDNVFREALSAEFYFNLFATRSSPAGILVRRRLVPPPASPHRLPSARSTQDEVVFRALRAVGLDPGTVFTKIFRALPRQTPALLEHALAGLEGRYRQVSHRVYNMGSANLVRTLVEEIGLPAEHLDAFLDDCSALAHRLFASERRVLTAPIGVRFVRPSRALLAVPQPTIRDAGGRPRPVKLWAMVNFALTAGTPRGLELLRTFYEAALGYGGRSHPGKCHFDSREHMGHCYDLDRFLAIRNIADPEGCFLNAWNREILGFSAGPDVRG